MLRVVFVSPVAAPSWRQDHFPSISLGSRIAALMQQSDERCSAASWHILRPSALDCVYYILLYYSSSSCQTPGVNGITKKKPIVFYSRVGVVGVGTIEREILQHNEKSARADSKINQIPSSPITFFFFFFFVACCFSETVLLHEKRNDWIDLAFKFGRIRSINWDLSMFFSPSLLFRLSFLLRFIERI